MTEKRAHDIEGFLSELSDEAWSYYLPGRSREGNFIAEPVTFYKSEVAPFEGMLCDEEAYEYHPRRSYSAPRKRFSGLGNGTLFSLIIPEEAEPPVADLELDERTKRIMKDFDELIRKYELNVEEVEILLTLRTKLSRLRITSKYEILLEDFDRKEVKMDTLTKAVFLLYLNHPEGIRYKELSDHQQELEKIYSSITGREDLDSIRKSVADLCDPLNNSINEKVSKVKKAFRDVVNDRVAKFYYIDGERGAAKRIALDRRYVI